jgi:hypothetical protein
MVSFIAKLFSKYNIDDEYKIYSPKELKLRQEILNTKTLISSLFNQILSQEEKAYFIYTVISGLEICANTYEIEWSKYKNKLNDNFYSSYIALSDGQHKLLISLLLNNNNANNNNNIRHIFNCYQLAYLNHVLENEKWNICDYEQYFYPEREALYEGKRESNLDEIMYNFFDNPQTKYSIDNMITYFILTFRKCYNYNRLNINNQSIDLNQLKDLLGVLCKNINIKNKFNAFLTILDEKQILLIGH